MATSVTFYTSPGGRSWRCENPDCENGGTQYTPGRLRKWCSDRCRKRQYDLVCVDCGGRVCGTDPGKISNPEKPRCYRCSPRALENRATTMRVVYEDGDMFACLRAASRNGVLSKLSYDRWRTEHNAPSSRAMILRFGSWSQAVAAAGLKAGKVMATPQQGFGAAKFTFVDCVEALHRCYEDTGVIPTYDEYHEWRRSNRTEPSAGTIRNHAPNRKWSAVLLDAFDRRAAA